MVTYSACSSVADCEECNQEHEGDCPVHGPLLAVEDTPVSCERVESFLCAGLTA